METSFFSGNLSTFLVLFAATCGLVGMFLALSAWLGPKKMNEIKAQPFECGTISKTDARAPYPIKFYLVAVLFIVFDIEIAFLYPWAVSFGSIGIVGFIAAVIFLAILGVGLYYEVSKRVLEWK
ncbi:NADH-quinone oxidoreductase subunit A [bacterium]|nr:NADH-quinone oxidoreductase subunit A [bacterium]MBU1985378.1 NADH-quinone oxidoreductase subunit A [bacterium]